MTKEEFLSVLTQEVQTYNSIVATEKGDWIVKGFIDIYKNIYTISIDTKVVSKVLELLLIPAFENFAKANDLTLELPKQQNHYPDLTFISKSSGLKFAVDIKSTFKDTSNRIKSMTLGAFTGYFRKRDIIRTNLYPYGDYAGHYVLGVVYSQNPVKSDEKAIFKLDDLDKIESVIHDFLFFVQPKYKIASASPGSGNTKNIGSTRDLQSLINGRGVFADLGEEIYDDYWMYYLTNDMAKTLDIARPYTNLKTYQAYKQKGNSILQQNLEKIQNLSEDEDPQNIEDVSEEVD